MTDFTRLVAALADRYRIERELGQGGMATVYLAQDLRHDRKVAVKVLRPELAAVIGAERFLSEIKTTANLQHPHILPLFDSGTAGARDGGTEFLFYVMPFIEGESLRDRLSREKQLPIDDAVRIAKEVASALDYAHRHGIIHRDIKPENVMLHDGSALVADFGIALAASKAGGTRMTETGMSLGTPHYMSPEQAMGEREITARSDVYALGATLYEMLVGEPPFTGPTAQSIVAKVLTEDPRPLLPKRHTIPSNIEAAVLRALEKLPADRFGTAAEMGSALGDPGYRGVSRTLAMPGVPGSTRARPGNPLLIAAGVLIGLLLGAGLFAALGPRRPALPVIRYALALPQAQTPQPGWRTIPSPDGSRIAYIGPAGNRGQIWIKERDRYEATPLDGTLGVTNFTWSPDGEWIAFVLSRAVRKVPVTGGASIQLADSVSGNPGIAWLDDGTIVIPRQGATGLLRVPASGGPATIIVPDTGILMFPTALPGSRAVLFTRCGASCAQQAIWAVEFESGRQHEVLPGAIWAQYVETGHLLYVRDDGAMFAVPFDPGKLETRGSPIPVEDSIAVLSGIYPLVSLSRSGTLITQRGAPRSLLQLNELVWVDRTGRESPVDSGWTFRFTGFGGNVGWSLSPDGSRLAIGLATDEGDDIWLKRLPRGPLSRISYDPASEYRPRWLPDNRTIMYGSNRTGPGGGVGGLYSRRADGTGTDSLIIRSARGVFEGQFSPDRTWLVYRTGGTIGQTGGRDIIGIRPGIDTAPVPVVVTPYDEEGFMISPDGRWIAYESNETGRSEIFLRPFPNTDDGKWQVSNGGGVAPLWSRNGRELFYVSDQRDMMAMTVTPGVEPGLGDRRRLFHLRDELYLTPNEYYTPFDVGADGRFIMARPVPLPPGVEAPIIVVENWLDELKAQVRK